MTDDSDRRKEPPSESSGAGSRRLPAEKRGEGTDPEGGIGRRDYLRLGTAAAAATAGFAGLPTAAAATTRKGITFDETVDAVDDLGLDPTGAEPVDDALENALASGALVEFPAGEYRVTREITVDSKSGIRGLGDSRSDVRFVPDTGYNGIWLRFGRPNAFLVENVTLDRRDDYDTSIGMMGNVERNLQIHEVEYDGWTPSGPQMLVCNVTDPDGELVADGFYRTGPTAFEKYPESSLDIYIGTGSEATHTLRNVEIHNGSESGIYAGKAPGPVRVEDSYFKNCVHTAVRVAGKDSWVKGTTIVMDTEDWDERNEVVESTYDGDPRIQLNRGIWTQTYKFEKAGPLVEDCDVIVKNCPGGIAGILNEGDCGGIRIRNTRVRCDEDDVMPIHIDEEWNFDVMNPPYEAQIENVSVTGTCSGHPGILVGGRDGTTIRDSCIDMPNSQGIVFDGTQDGLVENCNISAGGQATVFDDAQVEVTNVGSGDSCQRPTEGPRPSTDDGSSDSTSASDDTDTSGSTSDSTATSDDSTSGDSTSDDSTSGDDTDSASSDDSGSGTTGRLEVVSVDGGPLFRYEFTVEGGVERIQDGSDTESELTDSITDSGDGTATVSGQVGNGYGDSFRLTDATVTDFETDTSADDFFLRLDGQRVTVDELLSSGGSDDSDAAADGDSTQSTFRVTSVEDGPPFRYEFTAPGRVERVQDGSETKAEASDVVTDNGDGTWTVSGKVGLGYADTFRLAEPSLTDFQAGTDAENYVLRLDGQRVTADELLSNGGSGDGSASDSGTDSSSDSGSTSSGSTTTGENFVFTNRAELQAVAERATAGDEPWASAWAKVKSSADDALGVSLQSVTEDGGGNDFTLDRNDRHDYRTAIRTGDRVRNLALAHFVTGEDRYAEKAIDQIHHWFLDPDTYQYPRGSGDYGVEQYITIPKFLMGAAVLRGHPYWETKSADTPWNGGSASSAEDALAEWARTWADNLSEPNANNIWIWLAVAEGAAAAYADDDTLFQQAIDRYKADESWNDYNDDGSFGAALGRSNGFRYQLFRMKSHAMFCELARHRGEDLYEYNDLKRAFDWMATYVKDPDQWQWGTGSLEWDRTYEAPGVYELVYSVWQEPAYRDVVQRQGRPVDDGRLLQWVTFTHGDRHELDLTSSGDSSSSGESLPNTVRVDGAGSASTYEFEVSDRARKVQGGSTDTASGTTIRGTVDGEQDVYEFAGSVRTLTVDGTVDITFEDGDSSD